MRADPTLITFIACAHLDISVESSDNQEGKYGSRIHIRFSRFDKCPEILEWTEYGRIAEKGPSTPQSLPENEGKRLLHSKDLLRRSGPVSFRPVSFPSRSAVMQCIVLSSVDTWRICMCAIRAAYPYL